MTTAIQTIEEARFAKSHWSLLAYIETRCVDYQGTLNRSHMRCNPNEHPGHALRQHDRWEDSYSTAIRNEAGEIEKVIGHDDWHIVDDLEAAGFIESGGTGINPVFSLTKKGRMTVGELRHHKANGGKFMTFRAE